MTVSKKSYFREFEELRINITTVPLSTGHGAALLRILILDTIHYS